MPAKMMTPEACRVAKEIFDKFYQWANERIEVCEEIKSLAGERHAEAGARCSGQITALIFAQRNLTQIVKDVTGVEK